MRFLPKKNFTEGHNWFAWYPVLCSIQTDQGIHYEWVWLETVGRKIIRQAGVGVLMHYAK